MEDQIGNTFDGRISGMIEKGIFVELLDSKAEGLIKFSSLTENYDVADSRLVATGRRTGDEIKMGDRVQVKVLGTNIDNRLIDFELLEMKD
jgi:ribonuclease R